MEQKQTLPVLLYASKICYRTDEQGKGDFEQHSLRKSCIAIWGESSESWRKIITHHILKLK